MGGSGRRAKGKPVVLPLSIIIFLAVSFAFHSVSSASWLTDSEEPTPESQSEKVSLGVLVRCGDGEAGSDRSVIAESTAGGDCGSALLERLLGSLGAGESPKPVVDDGLD